MASTPLSLHPDRVRTIEETAPTNGTARPRWKGLLDAAVVLLVYAYNFPVTMNTAPETMPVAVVALIFVGVCLPFLWRRRYPVSVFVIILGFTSLHLLMGLSFAVADVMLVLALCSLTVRTHWTVTVAPLIATIAWVLVAVQEPFRDGYLTIGEVGLAIAVALLSYSWAIVLKLYRQYIASLRLRAVELQQAQKTRDLMIMAEERKRIARELHDVVSHSLGSVVALSEGAVATMTSDPEQARKAMSLVSDTGRTALDEMRAILALLRSGDEAEAAPQPGVGELDALVDTARSLGLDIEYRTSGDLTGLNPGLQLTIYRLVQESLTNVQKHAGPGSKVLVDMRCEPTEVHLVVTNSSPRHSEHDTLPSSGHGLAGMRERVQAYGGTLDAGAIDAGGFQVNVTIPTGEFP